MYICLAGFPALVLGIKEMRISVNLSHRVVSKGHFTSFGLRFTESFNIRQRAWATLTKKKMMNHGIYIIHINCGIYTLFLVFILFTH